MVCGRHGRSQRLRLPQDGVRITESNYSTRGKCQIWAEAFDWWLGGRIPGEDLTAIEGNRIERIGQ